MLVECDGRDKRRAARRIHDAGFPCDKRLEEFDFHANLNEAGHRVRYTLASNACERIG